MLQCYHSMMRISNRNGFFCVEVSEKFMDFSSFTIQVSDGVYYNLAVKIMIFLGASYNDVCLSIMLFSIDQLLY